MTRNVLEYSIIIPTYKRPAQLARCLAAIEALEFARDRFEVIVVDDGSDDPPNELIRGLSRVLDIRLVCARHGGPARARNTGALCARGRYLVFTDDDCAPHRDWLAAIDRWTSASDGTVAFGGQTVNVLADNVYASASQSIVEFLYHYFGDHPASRRFFTTNNLVVPRDQFMEIDGFDEGFELAAGEDRDLCERWRSSGRDLQFAPDVLVDHAHRLTLARFNRQHFNYGRGAFDLHKSRARRGDGSLKVEPAQFYYRLVTYPLRTVKGARALPLAALHFWSQVSYVSGYFFERIRRGWNVESGSPAGGSIRRSLDHADTRADESSMSGAA
ncbi:MAG TPA: glycosyltransferase [Gemmatimonadaceae bacterium]|nr:glycosyltransferase [Gemmatimonadaceae bacterium]